MNYSREYSRPDRHTGLERTYAVVEQAIGRPLRDAEKAIDVLRLDAALERAKDRLEQAIRAEMLRATLAWLRAGGFGTPQLEPTEAMRKPLDDLHRLGREEALLELDRLGYTAVRRSFAAPHPQQPGGLDEAHATVRRGLPGIGLRIEDELVHADLAAASQAAVAQALMRVPGARDLASQVVSTALTSGLAATFDDNGDLIGGWEYTAVLDGGTCDVCAPLDGTRYATLDALFEVLPNFGPNPSCRGRGRCRCRAVPIPAAEAPAAAAGGAPRPIGDSLATGRISNLEPLAPVVRNTIDAISNVHGVTGDPPEIPVRIVGAVPQSPGALAAYRYTHGGEAVDIMVTRLGERPAFSLAHEIGHYLDHQAIGQRGTFASVSGDDLADWRAAIDASEAIAELRRIRDSPAAQATRLPSGSTVAQHVDEYLLDPTEVFARSYSQWIAIRSGDFRLLQEFRRDQEDRYPEQWSDQDFEQIARAFDELVRRLGWTTS